MIKLQDFQKQNFPSNKHSSSLIVVIVLILSIFILSTKQKNIGQSYLIMDSVAVYIKEIDSTIIEKEVIKDSIILVIEPTRKGVVKKDKIKEEPDQIDQPIFQPLFNADEDMIIILIE